MRELFDKLLSGKQTGKKTEQSSNANGQPAEDLVGPDKVVEKNDDSVADQSRDGRVENTIESSQTQDSYDAGPETNGQLVSEAAVTLVGDTPSEEPGTGMDAGDQASPSPALQAVLLSHIGKIRSRNEDSAYMFTAETGGQEPLVPFGLYIVADGMGGHHAGHEASKDVSRLVAQHVLERIYVPLLKNTTGHEGGSQEPVREVMLDAVQIANKHIYHPEPGKDSGTTLTAALVFGRRLYVAHVGDSRAYLLLNDELKQVTTDHSYVRRLQEAGQLTEEEAAIHPQRNMLYRAVGQGGELEIDTFTQSLPAHGDLLLCSDGLWGLVSEQIMKDVLSSAVPLGRKVDALVELALQFGGHDNISAILVEFCF